MDKQFIEAFEGAKGRAEVWEIASKDSMGVETIEYEIIFDNQRQVLMSMGEASVLASELSGDRRFMGASSGS